MLLLTEPAQLLCGVLLTRTSVLQARWCWCSEAAATTQTRPAHWQRPMQQACLSTTASQVSDLVSALHCVSDAIFRWNASLPAAGMPYTPPSVPENSRHAAFASRASKCTPRLSLLHAHSQHMQMLQEALMQALPCRLPPHRWTGSCGPCLPSVCPQRIAGAGAAALGRCSGRPLPCSSFVYVEDECPQTAD